jgi:hypothetical protein
MSRAKIDARAFKQNLASQINRWCGKLTAIREKEQKVATKDRSEFRRQINLMEAKLDALQDDLLTVQNHGDKVSSMLEANIRKSFHEVNDAFDSAMAKLMC